MGYLHIDNLYKPGAQAILMFKECYALEKIHGASAHISWKFENKSVGYFAGGESHERFVACFDADLLASKFDEFFPFEDVVIYGEAYGGKQQGMSGTYGKDLKFAAFDVTVGKVWVAVPNAEDICQKLGIEFVAYEKVSTELEALNFERDRDSRQAIRNGVGEGKAQEGVVLRPLVEMTLNNGSRVICKHKRDEFKETKTAREVSPEALAVLDEANAIAEEWVTPQRLLHVLDKLPQGIGPESTKQVIDAMTADVYREGAGELVESRAASKSIGVKTAKLFNIHLKSLLTK